MHRGRSTGSESEAIDIEQIRRPHSVIEPSIGDQMLYIRLLSKFEE